MTFLSHWTKQRDVPGNKLPISSYHPPPFDKGRLYFIINNNIKSILTVITHARFPIIWERCAGEQSFKYHSPLDDKSWVVPKRSGTPDGRASGAPSFLTRHNHRRKYIKQTSTEKLAKTVNVTSGNLPNNTNHKRNVTTGGPHNDLTTRFRYHTKSCSITDVFFRTCYVR